jgi:hypothetical protein
VDFVCSDCVKRSNQAVAVPVLVLEGGGVMMTCPNMVGICSPSWKHYEFDIRVDKRSSALTRDSSLLSNLEPWSMRMSFGKPDSVYWTRRIAL